MWQVFVDELRVIVGDAVRAVVENDIWAIVENDLWAIVEDAVWAIVERKRQRCVDVSMGRLTCGLCAENRDAVSALRTNACSARREQTCVQHTENLRVFSMQRTGMWPAEGMQRVVGWQCAEIRHAADLKACRGSICGRLKARKERALNPILLATASYHEPPSTSDYLHV